jgi:transposase
MDNYATHKTEPIRKWLGARPRWHVHFTPTASSWVTQVERLFAAITERQIRRRVHRSTAELDAAIPRHHRRRQRRSKVIPLDQIRR